MTLLQNYKHNENGAVTVEASLISGIMIMLTLTAFEFIYGFFQWNTAQQAVRVGARLAATTQPVSQTLETMTGLEGGANPGDPMPDYVHSCTGETASCSSGGFNSSALNEIIYGPDNDGVCEATTRARRGMCDLFKRVAPENVEIEYRNSGFGRAGTPATPAPLITVTLKNIDFDFALIGNFAPQGLRKMPPVSVTVIAEDLRSGT